MGSQRSQDDDADLQELLNEAVQWTDEEIQEKLPTVLPAIISFLRRSPDPGNGVQVARFALGAFLSHLEFGSEAFELFKCAVPSLQSFFTTFLEKCTGDEDKDTEAVNQILQQCILIIECCLLTVQFLCQAGTVCIENMEEVPQAVLHIVNASFQHCDSSKDTYADCFEAVSDSLTELCRQTVDLSLHFANFAPKITFDTFNEEDLEALVCICEQLCLTASHLSRLSDLKAFVAVWRAYANLVSQHHSSLTTALDTSVSLKALVKEINNGFEMLKTLPFDDKASATRTQKIMQRTIKTMNFCLKIVVAICEKYRGYLRASHCSIASLLLLLLRYSPGNVSLKNFPGELKDEIETQLMIGIEPLLLHLREDEDFVKVLFEDKKELMDEITEDYSSYLLLLIAVAVPPSATVLIHMKKFLSAIFSAMQKSHVSLSFPCTMNGVMCKGKQQSKVPLYEHVLTRMCVLVAGFSSTQFKVLEEILIEWLLSGQTWPALLAADVWCFVVRYGTSELCWDYCILLLDIIPKRRVHSHQCLIVASLLSRLITKLAPKDRGKLVSILRERRLKRGMGTSLLFSMLQFGEVFELREVKSSVLKTASKNITSALSRKATGEVLFSLKEDLEAISQLSLSPSSSNADISEKAAEKEFAETLAQLWKRMPEKLIGATAVDEMVSYMVHSSVLVLKHFSNAQLFQILSLCRRCVTCGTPVVCLAVSNLIGALGRISVTSCPEEDGILSLISECLSSLLKSSNSLVLQSALEALVTFGRHTVHEKVLPMSIAECDEDLQLKVTNYLKQEPLPAPAGHSRLSLLQLQVQDRDSGDANSTYVSIDSIAGAVPADIGLAPAKACGQDDRGLKRKRLDGSPLCDSENVSSLIAKLQESQGMLVDLSVSGSAVKPDDRRKIRRCLQEMLELMEK